MDALRAIRQDETQTAGILDQLYGPHGKLSMAEVSRRTGIKTSALSTYLRRSDIGHPSRPSESNRDALGKLTESELGHNEAASLKSLWRVSEGEEKRECQERADTAGEPFEERARRKARVVLGELSPFWHTPPPLAAKLLDHLGMRSAVFEGDGAGPYVQRQIDQLLIERLKSALASCDSAAEEDDQWCDRVIVVAGPAKAGKTRTVAEALAEATPQQTVLVVRPPGAEPVLAEVAEELGSSRRERSPTKIVFIDDLERHLRFGGLLHRMFRQIAEPGGPGQPGRVVVATLHDSFLSKAFPEDYGLTPGDVKFLVDRSRGLMLDAMLDDLELKWARDAFAGQPLVESLADDELRTLGERCAAVRVLLARVAEARTGQGTSTAHLAAFADAVQTIHVVARDEGMDRAQLERVTEWWWKRRHGFEHRRFTSEAFEAAMDWATEPVGDARRHRLTATAQALLLPHPVSPGHWLAMSAVGEKLALGFDPPTELSAVLDEGQQSRLVRFMTGQLSEEHVSPVFRTRSGGVISATGKLPRAGVRELLDALCRKGHAPSLVMASRSASPVRRIELLTQAAQTGDVQARWLLGYALADDGRIDAAIEELEVAAVADYTPAAAALGMLFLRRAASAAASRGHDLVLAQSWYSVAAEAGTPGAAEWSAIVAYESGDDRAPVLLETVLQRRLSDGEDVPRVELFSALAALHQDQRLPTAATRSLAQALDASGLSTAIDSVILSRQHLERRLRRHGLRRIAERVGSVEVGGLV